MDVTTDRDKFVGGSDLPIIMGLSRFKSRWDLLEEKAGLKENTFEGNEYTEYGNVLEPKIRNHINEKYKRKFEPNRTVKGDIRCHTDGFDGNCVLEIKTTSNIREKVDEYKSYLVQLLLYMDINEVEDGMLAVYERPSDFALEFNPEKLSIFAVKKSDYTKLISEIYQAIEMFIEDLKRLKENPLLSECDLMPKEVTDIAERVLKVEEYIKELKKKEKEYEVVKKALYESMMKHSIKSWVGVNGSKITKIDEVEPKEYIYTVFDERAFKAENLPIWEMYQKDVVKKKAGRKGYVKITVKE